MIFVKADHQIPPCPAHAASAIGFSKRRGPGWFPRAAALLAVILLSGCATLPGTVTETVNERRVEYALQRHGEPAVVFENGLGGRMPWWAQVWPEIARDHTAFAYNRPGYGNSDPAGTPRDGEHVVEELRALLRAKGLNPPYVLVGHSLGGLYMQYFARRHPQEVAGLVLVDASHPLQFQGMGSPENWPGWVRAGFTTWLSSTETEEFRLMNATGESVLALPPLTGKPVIVMSALQPMAEKGALADDANQKRQDIVRLFPGAKQVWVDSGHGIPRQKPEAVIQAIRELLKAAATAGAQVSDH